MRSSLKCDSLQLLFYFISYENDDASEVCLPTRNFGMICTRKHALEGKATQRDDRMFLRSPEGEYNESDPPPRATWTEPLWCDERGRVSHIDCLSMGYPWDRLHVA